MTVQRGILTSQDIPVSGRKFLVADEGGPPCYQDPWGDWACGHDHTPSVALQDDYQNLEGWTAQARL
jgi:hypothetical protein